MSLSSTVACARGFSSPGQRAKNLLAQAFLAGLALLSCALCACGDDGDPAPQTPAAGGAPNVEPTVRDLPGDGIEPTPESDTDSRQRNPVGPAGINEAAGRLRDGLDGASGQGGSASDASAGGAPAGDPADAGSD